MPKSRYRVYREHKYVQSFLAELENYIAKVDFRSDIQLATLAEKVSDLSELMNGHAEHEDKTIHQLLRNKGSQVQAHIEDDHRAHSHIFTDLQRKLENIKKASSSDQRLALGYDFYLSFREFEAKNLEHINEEERIIMPELQRLYTDEELRQGIDFKIYQSMTAEQMFHMLKVLFPQYNVDDKLAFLKDILDASQSEKFAVVWRQVFDE